MRGHCQMMHVYSLSYSRHACWMGIQHLGHYLQLHHHIRRLPGLAGRHGAQQTGRPHFQPNWLRFCAQLGRWLLLELFLAVRQGEGFHYWLYHLTGPDLLHVCDCSDSCHVDM